MPAMSNLFSRLDTTFRSPSSRVALIVALSTAFTAGTILSTQAVRRRTRRVRLRDEVEQLLDAEDEDELGELSATQSGKAGKGKGRRKTSEVIVRESLARNYVFFGEEGMEKIRESFVVVVGLGGVGSAAATMLVRSGVKKIRLIDFDQVSVSSLNRHATATLAQVGTPKVTSCADYFESIAPWVEVDARVELFGQDVADELLGGDPDYVIDCIDNIDSKVELLAYCHSHKIPVFSSLGAGAKSDPSRIQISDISATFEDPLARSVRRRLRIHDVTTGIAVVYSTEKPRPEIALLPLPEEEFQKGKVDELSAIANFRVRILPVLGPLPAMFGNAAAAYVLQILGGFPMEPLPVKNRHKMATSMHKRLTALEFKLTGSTKLPIGEDDVLYFFEEIHRARSVAPPYAIPSQPSMMRWRKDRRLDWDNIVVFERDEGNLHEEHCLRGNEDPELYWGKEVTALVNRRTEEERRLRHYRL